MVGRSPPAQARAPVTFGAEVGSRPSAVSISTSASFGSWSSIGCYQLVESLFRIARAGLQVGRQLPRARRQTLSQFVLPGHVLLVRLVVDVSETNKP
jgi:hypothetical protein